MPTSERNPLLSQALSDIMQVDGQSQAQTPEDTVAPPLPATADVPMEVERTPTPREGGSRGYLQAGPNYVWQ